MFSVNHVAIYIRKLTNNVNKLIIKSCFIFSLMYSVANPFIQKTFIKRPNEQESCF